MSAKHTPGPWYAVCPADIDRAYVTNATGKGTIARFGAWAGMDPKEHESNVHLITKAPELLAHLKLLAAAITPEGYFGRFATVAEYKAAHDLIAELEGL